MSQLEAPPSTHRVTLDQVFDVLGHPIRRRVLVALADRNALAVEALESVADNPHDRNADAIAIELHHVHLPRLEAAGFVDLDDETGTIRRGPAFRSIRPLLELFDEHAHALPDGWP